MSPSTPNDLDNYAEAILYDNSIPLHLRTVSQLLEDRKQLHVMISYFRELNDVITGLKEEIINLKNVASTRRDPSLSVSPLTASDNITSSLPESNRSFYEEIERSRSLVVAGLSENRAYVASSFVHHDFKAFVIHGFFLNRLSCCQCLQARSL